MHRPHHVYAYVRVSSPAQARDGSSLDGQRDRIVAWCAERSYPAPTFLVEVESGVEEARDRRIQLDRLLTLAARGDLVIVSLVDRLGRDLFDGIKTARQLVRGGVGLVAIDEEGGPVDAGTIEGMDRLEQQLLAAQREARRIKTRTVGARRRIQAAGLYASGTVSFGYRRGARAQKRQHHLEIVPEEAALVRGAFERAAASASLEDIAAWLGVELNDSTLSRHRVWGMLRCRYYLGEVRGPDGSWIAGQHEAIVSRDLWERAKAGLALRQRGGRRVVERSRTSAWLLRSLGCCPECGARMSAAYGPGGRDYYACGVRLRVGSCSAPYVRVVDADADADRQALARLIELRALLARPPVSSAPAGRPRDFQLERGRIADQRRRAQDGWVRGLLDDVALARAMERLDGELGRLEVAEAEAKRLAAAADPAARRAALADVRKLDAAWSAAPVAVRRTAIAILAKTIRISPEAVEIEWRTPEELTATGTANLFRGTDDVPPRGRR